MIIEAFDTKGTKYKVGMEVQVGSKTGYIFDILVDETGKMKQLLMLNKELDTYMFASPSSKGLKPTGNYEPDILKLKRKLAK